MDLANESVYLNDFTTCRSGLPKHDRRYPAVLNSEGRLLVLAVAIEICWLEIQHHESQTGPDSVVNLMHPMQDDFPVVAILGPLGTYSHQAAYKIFGNSVKYREERTITDVFNTLSDKTPLAVIPQENSIFGSVVETYDLLRIPEVGRGKLVKGTATLSIQHCFLVRKGVKFEEVQRILSHEQAFGQCTEFIKKHFPHALLEKMPSTAAAAQAVSKDGDHVKTAAICSRICSTIFNNLEVLREGIQNGNVNTTRFYILGLAGYPVTPPTHGGPRCALVRTSRKPNVSERDATPICDIGTVLAALGLHSTRLDRRPSLSGIPNRDVYFVEVEQVDGKTSGLQNWQAEVERALRRVESINGEISLLGIW